MHLLYLKLVKWLFRQCTNEDGLDYATVANSSKTLSGLKQQKSSWFKRASLFFAHNNVITGL